MEAGQGKVEARGPACGSHGPEREEGMEEGGWSWHVPGASQVLPP